MSKVPETLKPFLKELSTSVRHGSYQKLVISRPLSNNEQVPSKVTVRPILIDEETMYQWIERVGPRELHQNLSADQLIQRIPSILGSILGDARLFTSEAEICARYKGRGHFQLHRAKGPQAIAEPEAHNREKNYIIPANTPCPFLAKAGIMTADGRVKASMYHKFKQINRYLELIRDLKGTLQKPETLRVVDYGCGKSYLTFALHHYLTVVEKKTVEMTGMDQRPDVIATCTAIADELQLEGLDFRVGQIVDLPIDGKIDLAVSLHACDTATDEALAAAVLREAQVIVAVPCCQHELRPQISGESLAGLWKHGILAERFAADVTDALRALWLEQQGYQVQVIEFIELEHTPKNLAIRAVRVAKPSRESIRLAEEKSRALKELCGIASTWLDRWDIQRADAK
ncbi:MAG: SAM-dependent methyltransferase [Planctomyces sp.]|nr:SAM-dependent methyltransferase [Planctomyces sp.]